MLEEQKVEQEEQKVEQQEQIELPKEDAIEESQDPQFEIKQEFERAEGIEFTQTLDKEDIKTFNLFLIKHDSSALVKRSFLIFAGVLFIVMSIITKKNYYMIALGSVLVIYATVLYNTLRVAYLKSRIDKNPPEPIEINVKITDQYIRYQLKEETDSPLVSFNNIYKVVKNKDYLYLFINRYSIVVLKLNSIEQKEKVLEQVKNRYLPRKSYFEK